MAFVALPAKLWVPNWYFGIGDIGSYPPAAVDTAIDADEEELQYIGRVFLAAGSGSKTFNGAGACKVGWLAGASITFTTNSTVRVGIKQASSIDAAAGPAARATIGAAAFDVYKDLVGGTDAINATSWHNTTMATGAGITVTHGDLIAICFHMNTSEAAGTHTPKIRSIGTSSIGMPATTLVTTGPTYSQVSSVPNAILIFTDSTIGWIEGSWPHSVGVTAENIGNTNIYGNNFQLPFRCKVDAVMAQVLTAGTTNFDVGLWSTPNSTPTAMTNGTVSVDPQILGSSSQQTHIHLLPAAVTLEANTEYMVGCKQNSASNIALSYFAVDVVSHHAASGADSTCYAVKSTAGAAVAIQASGLRRAGFYARISEVDVTAASGSIFIG